MKRQSLAVIGRTVLLFIAVCCLVGCGKTPPNELAVDLGGGMTMQFVLIRPGTFQMGSAKGVQGPSEEPVHKVTITKPFYLGKYLVTQEQWERVMGSNPSSFKGAKNPVESVNWDDCQNFIVKLKEKVPGQTFRLPTEAEWEYACRAGSTTDYSFGDGESSLGEYAWYTNNSVNTTHAVGEKKPNAWGLYDMHGNVWECCADYVYGYIADDQTDPVGPSEGPFYIVRGGAWNDDPTFLRSSTRSFGGANRLNSYGLRCALAVGASLH
jgi:formylglycine-generating enzyme required for sulfatase activity